MDRRIFGVIFLAIGAALYACRFVCAAIYASGMASQSREFFDLIYHYVGFGLTGLALAFFTLGAIYFVWGELENSGKSKDFARKARDYWITQTNIKPISSDDDATK